MDRIAGSLLALTCVALTVVLLSIIIATMVRRRHSAFSVFLFRSAYTLPFYLWLLGISLLGAIFGAKLGTLRVIEMLGHLWGIEQPPNHQLSGRLWFGFVASGFVTFVLVFPWNRLLP